MEKRVKVKRWKHSLSRVVEKIADYSVPKTDFEVMKMSNLAISHPKKMLKNDCQD